MALVLNGSSQYGDINDLLVAIGTTDAFTACIWYKPSALTADMFIFGLERRSSFRREYGMHIRGDQANDPVAGNLYGGSDSFSSNGGTPNTDDWRIAIIAKDTANDQEIYDNSSTELTNTWGTGTDFTTMPLQGWAVGAVQASAARILHFAGKVAHFAVYNSLLNSTQIGQLVSGVAPDDSATLGVSATYYRELISDSTTGVGAATLTINGSPSYDADDPFAAAGGSIIPQSWQQQGAMGVMVAM